ncbi:MAG: molybdopterin-dependent oxidoreductase [Chloroflexota bacterium]|nr:molybdopterin-dependent oxidoreductase [Chloroflexota bacterium]MDE2958917.1 molybdopterin-dependent oxidoreductase [Chloroflexota bacterium]
MTQPEHAAVYDALPVFDNHHGRPEVWPGLKVEGLVERPTVFSAAELLELTRQTIVDDFRCVDGWTAPGQEWEGVPLAVFLDMVKPLPTARFAAIAAADFQVGVALEDPSGVLLATRLNGADLPEEHGGPCRLVSVGQACYASVKWVDSITLTGAAPEETAREIAMGRNAG